MSLEFWNCIFSPSHDGKTLLRASVFAKYFLLSKSLFFQQAKGAGCPLLSIAQEKFQQKLQLGLDLCSLANTATQVVQLCTTHLALADGFHLNHVGGMHGEYLFHAHAIGDTADGEGFVDAAVLLGDDSAFEDLDTPFAARP